MHGKQFLDWRCRELCRGGKAHELDWLLDLSGGLSRRELQLVLIDSNRDVCLQRSLDELGALWKQYLHQNVPLQYLAGVCPWRDLLVEVTPAVLIPRQESEVLPDLALAIPRSNPIRRWADLGTGSGALAISMARAWPEAVGHAVDQSPEALSLAARNFSRYGLSTSCQLHRGSWWQPLLPWSGQFDLVLSNPPYIPSRLIKSLSPNVRDHEPKLALDGGGDGLDCIRSIVAGAAQALAPGGWLLLEHHHDHSQRVLALLREAGLLNVEAASDPCGIARFAMACRSAEDVSVHGRQDGS